MTKFLGIQMMSTMFTRTTALVERILNRAVQYQGMSNPTGDFAYVFRCRWCGQYIMSDNTEAPLHKEEHHAPECIVRMALELKRGEEE